MEESKRGFFLPGTRGDEEAVDAKEDLEELAERVKKDIVAEGWCRSQGLYVRWQ